jgi:hypothetical protein
MLDFIRENTLWLNAILLIGGFSAVISYMYGRLTPRNKEKMRNLRGSYLKTLINATIIGAGTVALLIALGLI